METTTTTKETRQSRQETQSQAEIPQQELHSASDFFADIQLFDQLASQKKDIESRMETLRLKIIPSFNERFASLGIALPQSVIEPLAQHQNRSQTQMSSNNGGVEGRGNRGKSKGGKAGGNRARNGGVTKLQTAMDIITNKLNKKFTVKEFRSELEAQGKGNWQFGYLIQELRQRNFIKNVGYGEYERV